MDFKPELILATLRDYPVIQNLARFYAYDMSRYCGQAFEGWEFPENGLYEAFDLKKYFKDESRHSFLIKINGELAGFVLINKLEIIPETDWNMGEFFIIAKFQRSGIGAKVAQQVFERFKGEWSVGAIPQNIRAVHFWRKVIAQYTQGNFHEDKMTSEQLKTPDHPDPYPMIMFRFRS